MGFLFRKVEALIIQGTFKEPCFKTLQLMLIIYMYTYMSKCFNLSPANIRNFQGNITFKSKEGSRIHQFFGNPVCRYVHLGKHLQVLYKTSSMVFLFSEKKKEKSSPLENQNSSPNEGTFKEPFFFGACRSFSYLRANRLPHHQPI